jgi:maltooligosyltrehalose trehalohydrolase
VRTEGGVAFRVWAPKAKDVDVQLESDEGTRKHAMIRAEKGYFECLLGDARPGDRYMFVLDGTILRPDPASRFQPGGVHGQSQVVDDGEFMWTDGEWKGLPLTDFVIYEVHIGTFTKAGTFEGAIAALGYLSDLGITALELMPVGQFPGKRNWGYDGVYPYAPQNSYGGPSGLKALVDACHRKNMAVILDVVYNHLGPEGNYLNDFGYYFTDRYRTPWGAAVNYDGSHCDEVRRYFIGNACYWVEEFHIDALRLDAVHGIFDFGARHFLRDVSDEVHGCADRLGRKIYLVAESDLNDARVISPPGQGGYGMDSQWNDDFHHSLHALLTGERRGYYEDFGRMEQLVKAISEGYVYTGQYSRYRRRSHGNSSRGRPARQFVHFIQNHDQIGNRPRGDRLIGSGGTDEVKLAVAAILFCPSIPLFFMGEEYGETAPFLYFTDYSDPSLVEAVRAGRMRDCGSCDTGGVIPDPAAEETFLLSRIDYGKRSRPGHANLLAFFREALRLRRTTATLRTPSRKGLHVETFNGDTVLAVTKRAGRKAFLILFNFADIGVSVNRLGLPGEWRKVLDSAATRWGGPGEQAAVAVRGGMDGVALSRYNAVVYETVLVQAS